MNSGSTYLLGNITNYPTYVITTIKKHCKFIFRTRATDTQKCGRSNISQLFRNNQFRPFDKLCSFNRTYFDSVGPSGRTVRGVSLAAYLLGLRIRIPPSAWISACCVCCVLSVRDLYDVPIPRSEESY